MCCQTFNLSPVSVGSGDLYRASSTALQTSHNRFPDRLWCWSTFCDAGPKSRHTRIRLPPTAASLDIPKDAGLFVS